MPPKETVYYRVDDLPKRVFDEFERATRVASAAAQIRGEGQLSLTAAFVALCGQENLDESVVVGQDLAAGFHPDEEVVDRGFHLPVELKDRLRAVAEIKGVKVGAVGRLLLIAKAAGPLVQSIEAGIAAGRAGVSSAARGHQQEAPA